MHKFSLSNQVCEFGATLKIIIATRNNIMKHVIHPQTQILFYTIAYTYVCMYLNLFKKT